MRVADPILEFLVVGAVSCLAIVSLFGPEIIQGLGLQYMLLLDSDALVQSLTALLAVLGILALPLVYFIGIISHHLTWWWWRRWRHAHWLEKWARSRPEPFQFVMKEFRGSTYGENCAGWDGMPFRKQVSVALDWCRFKLLHSPESQLQAKFLQQWHLYRITYGPITVISLTILFSASYELIWRADDLKWYPHWYLTTFYLGVLAACHLAAAERARLMWKYLYYFSTLSCSLPVKGGDERRAPTPSSEK